MDILFLIFVMLMMVAGSRIMSNLIPIPLPMLQVLIGALAALPPIGLAVELDPEIFMLLFIPPLLFYDGWKIPKREFTQHGGQIFAMSLILVLLSVLIIGYFVQWLLPDLPLALCFALAAILSPTDALAVIAIAKGKLPTHMMHQLEGEAMMNDATGLVAFKFAVAAAVTGYFSITSAAGSFVLVALGGLVVGALISWLVGKGHNLLRQRGLLDPSTYVLVVLLLPFASFFIAEVFHLSGILAAVAAGIIQSRVEMLPQKTSTRIIQRSVWQMLDYSFNGLVFILLGLQFPHIVRAIIDDVQPSSLSVIELSMVAIVLMAGMLIIRFFFAFGLEVISRKTAKKKRPFAFKQDLVVSGLMAVAGVRGSITLAGILSLPLFIAGEALPSRDALIFIAAAVIILSLVIGVLMIPLLLKYLDVTEESHDDHASKIKVKLLEASINWVNEWRERQQGRSDAERSQWVEEVANRLKTQYREEVQRLASMTDEPSDAGQIYKLEHEVMLHAIDVQRKALYRMRRHDEIDDMMLQSLLIELDYQESSIS